MEKWKVWENIRLVRRLNYATFDRLFMTFSKHPLKLINACIFQPQVSLLMNTLLSPQTPELRALRRTKENMTPFQNINDKLFLVKMWCGHQFIPFTPVRFGTKGFHRQLENNIIYMTASCGWVIGVQSDLDSFRTLQSQRGANIRPSPLHHSIKTITSRGIKTT